MSAIRVENNAQALALARWLEQEGWDDIFLDLDPERGLKAGERWEEALREAADRCEAVLFLVSRAWLSSEWCRDEFRLARHLRKRLFGILIEDIRDRRSACDADAGMAGRQHCAGG